MSNYTLPPAHNKDRIFLLQKSELEKRLDPPWYVYLKSIKDLKHKKTALKKLLLENPQYGANEIGIERTDTSEPRYVRITDINEFGELANELGKTASVLEEKYFLKENDILLARSGNTVGKSYLHKDVGYKCFFAGYMIRFKIDAREVLPEYVFAYTQTDFYKRWTKAIQRTTGQPNINAEEYKSLEIPLPNISIQGKVVKIYFDFLKQKKQNEAAAEKLLASIDDYLLRELGIMLPAPPENNLKNRVFKTTLKEILGNRFDSNYHQNYHKNNFISFKKSNYKTNTLKEITENIFQGVGKNIDEKSNFILLKVKNIKQNYEIDYEDTEKIGDFPLSKILKQGDIITPCIGEAVRQIKFAVFEKENDKYLVDNNTGVIRLNEKVNSCFANYCLCSSIGRLQINRFIGGGGVPFLGADNLKRFIIPVPPLAKQKEIADHITGIRQQARQLKEKTKEALSQASQEIEKILLA